MCPDPVGGLSHPGKPNPDEDEFITAFPVSVSDALSMIRDGRITDGKTIAGLYAALDRLGKMKLSDK